jgi:hypothetical protein
MILVCINSFGNFAPGDEIEMPDGTEFDHAFFNEAEASEADKENTE